jgi:hypothetical protein
MFYHNCDKHGQVFFDFSKSIKMLARTVGLTTAGIKVSDVLVSEIGAINSTSPEFYCADCNTDVDINSVTCVCGMCREFFPLDQLYKIAEVGSIYCSSCAEEFFPQKRRYNLKTIVSKFAD